ncbi:cysteine synthase family protein [Amycolatopsis sp. NPDC003861]
MTTVFADVVEAQRIPTVLRLGANLYALAYRLMKMVPARYILRHAHHTGLLGRHTTVVETTSGTFGLALAMQCAITGHPLVLVSDPVIDARLRRQLEDLGATVDIVDHQPVDGGYQAARLARLAEIRAGLPDTFCPEQYSNPDNPASYSMIGELLADRLGQVDCVVGPVGSGGSMCGTVRSLRQACPDLVAVGVDTHHSVLFGQSDGPRLLRGLGNSLMPPNLDHTQFDEVHWLGAVESFVAARRLHRDRALFMGPTSGASYAVGSWWAARHPDALTVIVLPDEGHRYLDTVYHDDWLAAHGAHGQRGRAEPLPVRSPADADDEWCRHAWRRRSLADVTGLAGLVAVST